MRAIGVVGLIDLPSALASLASAFDWRFSLTVLAAVVTIIVGIRTFYWRRLQLLSWHQSEKFQSDSHVLKLCQALSSDRQQLQLAAAALLLERLEKGGRPQRVMEQERSAIIQALLAATINDRETDNVGNAAPELCKYVADSVVDALDARNTRPRPSSPLRPYYWQRTRLEGAYWADVDARGIDLFGVDLSKASLRRANLEGTILYEANLRGAKLCGANLKKSNLYGADLCGADLRDDRMTKEGREIVTPTMWAGATFNRAKYDGRTQFPETFDPILHGMERTESENERTVARV